MTCCKCNKTGRCRNCSCVKAGIHCQSCLPSRLGSCSNITSTDTRQTATTDDIPSAEVSPSSSPLLSQSSSPPDSDSLQPISVLSSSLPASRPLPPFSVFKSPLAAATKAPLFSLPFSSRGLGAFTDLNAPVFSYTNTVSPLVSCTLPAPPDSPRPNSPPSSPTHSTDDKSYDDLLKDTYDEVVHWKKNCFKIPLLNAGKSFVTELSRLYSAFAEGSAIESTALMAAMVLPILLLQNPHKRSKTKEHIACLERRMKS